MIRILIRVFLSLVYALFVQAVSNLLRDYLIIRKEQRETNIREATLNNTVPVNRRKVYPCSENWPKHRDPTHGKVDWDIQWHVENQMQCRDRNQALAIGLTLQEKRNRGRGLFILTPDIEQATQVKPAPIANIAHHVNNSSDIGKALVRNIAEYERRTGRRRMQ